MAEHRQRGKMEWLNLAFDWARRRDVEMIAKRNAQGDWFVEVPCKDANGTFYVRSFAIECPVGSRNRRLRISLDEFRSMVDKELSRVMALARANRNKQNNEKVAFGSARLSNSYVAR